MNPGISEEAGQTIRGIAERLNPATLALIVANIAMLIFIFYALIKVSDFRDKMLNTQNEFAKHVTELLSKCIVPDK